ncbi:sterol O-acyltransferase 1-like isoform X1 [Zophobas morio]|uniref:sterol O-acyltransferase 1-like isoform X1 n=1 Tax=Zophobas morio TaxID=2755281 RepID=UPI003082C257
MCAKNEKIRMEKKFMIRNSLLTDIFEHPQTRNLYKIYVLVFAVLGVHTVGKEYAATGRVTFGFPFIVKGFFNLDKVIFFWLCCFASVCAVFYVFKIWSSLRARAKGGKVTVFNWLGATCLALYYVYSFKMATHAVRHFNLQVAGVLIVTLEQIRFLMKVHAFIRSKTSEEPSRLSFSNYLYFLFAPTLIYRDAYPRTNSINWKFVTQCLLESISAMFVIALIITNTYPSPERWARKFTINDVLFDMADKIILVPLYAMSMFFLVFHSVQNLFAEILQFGDRLFYLDWWNERSFNSWLTKWNKIVRDWLYYYVYRDFKEHVCDNVLLARLVVFLLSFGVHEWVMSCCIGGFFPYMFIIFMVMALPLSYFQLPKNIISEVVMWLIGIFAMEVGIVVYVLEWDTLSKNPLINPTLWESLVPRFVTADCALKF